MSDNFFFLAVCEKNFNVCEKGKEGLCGREDLFHLNPKNAFRFLIAVLHPLNELN